jgi:predicted lipid carrier protein YhbT
VISIAGVMTEAARIAGRLPQLPLSAAAAAALNIGVGGRMDRETLDALSGKVLRIAVRDGGMRVTLTCSGRAFHPRSSRGPADVTISASLADFLQLASRREDPDSLFFARRLLIEGDTELGLRVKNALDALDLGAIARCVEPVAAAFATAEAGADRPGEFLDVNVQARGRT